MKQTQGERLAAALKREPHTYMEMFGLGISVCPWKRLLEWEALEANAGWKLEKGRRMVWVDGQCDFLTTWAVGPRQ